MRVDLKWPCNESCISNWTLMTSDRKQGLWWTSNDPLAPNEGQVDLKWQTKQLIRSQVYLKLSLGTEQRLGWPHMNPNRLSGRPQMDPGCLIASQAGLQWLFLLQMRIVLTLKDPCGGNWMSSWPQMILGSRQEASLPQTTPCIYLGLKMMSNDLPLKKVNWPQIDFRWPLAVI